MQKREYEEGGLVITERVERESHAQPVQFNSMDKDRLRAFSRGEWWYQTVIVEIGCPTDNNWCPPAVVGCARYEGIASDISADRLRELFEELKAEAYEDARRLCSTLHCKLKGTGMVNHA